jgi:hypothetical protein
MSKAQSWTARLSSCFCNTLNEESARLKGISRVDNYLLLLSCSVLPMLARDDVSFGLSGVYVPVLGPG